MTSISVMKIELYGYISDLILILIKNIFSHIMCIIIIIIKKEKVIDDLVRFVKISIN